MSRRQNRSGLDGLMNDALRRGVFPSAVLLAARDGVPIIHASWGKGASANTIYDVASLTKAICTSLICMRFHDQGRLPLDAKTRRLLSHSAGLPAHANYFATAARRQAILAAVMAQPLERTAGKSSVYSDIGFIQLGARLEQIAGARLDVAFRREIARPLQLRDTIFGPLHGKHLARTARTGAPRGQVHDENARALGGVAGHAGVFSTADDLHRVADRLVGCWRGTNDFVTRATIRRFWSPALPGRSTWCLGWDTPSRRNSQAGTLLSRRAVGHLGFTGCSIWIDPARAVWIILLTNRVLTDPDRNRLRSWRPRIHDAAMRELGLA